MAFFPMFVELQGAPCLLVGGGTVALHKAAVLKDFGAKVTVVSPHLCSALQTDKQLACLKKPFDTADLDEKTLVVAATDNQALNRHIAQLCRERNIPVNAVDQAEDCSFIFPAYVKEGDVVAAFTSGGNSPLLAQHLKAQVRQFLTPELAELARFLGSIRPRVKKEIPPGKARRQAFHALLELGLQTHRIPAPAELEAVLAKYRPSSR